MNKVEEFLLEEAVDDLILSCDKNGEYVYASDMMQKYADQQCAIQLVSQRSELLKKWWKYFDEKSVAINCNDEEREEVITNFLIVYNAECMTSAYT